MVVRVARNFRKPLYASPRIIQRQPALSVAKIDDDLGRDFLLGIDLMKLTDGQGIVNMAVFSSALPRMMPSNASC